MEGNAENKRSTKKSNFKVGDKVILNQQQKDISINPFNTMSMVVTNVAVKSDENNITRNASH